MSEINTITLARDNASEQKATALNAREERAIYRAMDILETHLKHAAGKSFNTPTAVRKYLTLKLAREEREQFIVMFLDSQHRLIEAETMFYGTLSQTSVYPREVVKRALHHNAAALILAHNHPSGVAEPSDADIELTAALRTALALVDVRILDHFIVAANVALSLEENERNIEWKNEMKERKWRKIRAHEARVKCRPLFLTKRQEHALAMLK
ncbi:MAG TPA: DNA repair protein RadC [Gallionella sp.]